MIVVDTSALLAIALGEPEGRRCMNAMEAATDLAISAGTLAEALIVAGRRNAGPGLSSLIEDLDFEIVPVSPLGARQAADAYAKWGKGVHPAALNLGDCFAYALAKARGCPLLFIGDDFAKTDLTSALSPSP